ncbi:MAG: hypothetical protein BWY82_00856 [Verrucomicrobia bacterium ADurb.Bin474]|nr:MAG: hypothetical protein BWY82_00856 [Verrucomicrobia bacterium ADurb.Bin474]
MQDTLGGSTLTAFGTENDGSNHNNATSGFGSDGNGTFWEWTSNLPRGGGFRIDVNSDISNNYSIGVRFAFTQTGPGWRKIIDYKNLGADTGFYFYSGGYVRFYNHPNEGTTLVSNEQIVDIVATRSSEGTFIAYIVVDGILHKEIEVDDSLGQAIPSVVDGRPRFGFFHDDNATSSEATNAGKVYSVKIWNGPISEEDVEEAMNATISYNGNGHLSGVVPVDNSTYSPDDPVSIAGNTGNLTRTGYAFGGWNTMADGTGIQYLPGSVMLMPASSVVLYATWEALEPITPGETPDEPKIETYSYDLTLNTLNRFSWNLDPNHLLGEHPVHELVSGIMPIGFTCEERFITGTFRSTGIWTFSLLSRSGNNEVWNHFRLRVIPPTLTPLILGIWINGQYNPSTIIEDRGHGEAAITELINIHSEKGKPLELRLHSDYIKDEIGYRIVRGQLPAGMRFYESHSEGNPIAVISGTPVTQGGHLFVVSVKDWRGRGYQWIRLVVN